MGMPAMQQPVQAKARAKEEADTKRKIALADLMRF